VFALFLAGALAVFGGACCGGSIPAPQPSYTVVDSVQLGSQTVKFYVDLGHDSAVLGFALDDGQGGIRYVPMYASTYRGLPPVTLEVYAADSGEMWVASSWPGYEVIGYHSPSSHVMDSYAAPTPAVITFDSTAFPELDPATTSVVRTLQLP
jgi:hypothetical protein